MDGSESDSAKSNKASTAVGAAFFLVPFFNEINLLN